MNVYRTFLLLLIFLSSSYANEQGIGVTSSVLYVNAPNDTLNTSDQKNYASLDYYRTFENEILSLFSYKFSIEHERYDFNSFGYSDVSLHETSLALNMIYNLIKKNGYFIDVGVAVHAVVLHNRVDLLTSNNPFFSYELGIGKTFSTFTLRASYSHFQKDYNLDTQGEILELNDNQYLLVSFIYWL
ncbi:MAG: hypothetical protein OEW60_00235 [Thiovulaceae bacterium]|nr:hypothetical protein [Sulfurimonadaceae bacterium]